MPLFSDGLVMKFPSRTGGESYVMPLDIHDRQGVENKWDASRVLLVGQPAVFQSIDTSTVGVSNNTDVRIYVATSAGYTSSVIETDRAKILQTRYMQTAKDWKNVEITFQFIYKGGNDNGNIILGARGGLQENPCEGFAYKGILNLSGTSGSVSKQQYFPSGNTYRTFTTTKLGTSIKNKTVAMKLVLCDTKSDGKPTIVKSEARYVKCELYASVNGGEFRMLKSTTDNGTWSTDEVCGGIWSTVGLWGGPLAFVQWGGGAQIEIKSLTVREIDCTKTFTQTGTGSGSIPNNPEDTPANSTANNASPNDDYGVRKIYQTDVNGTQWYPPVKSITSDDRFDDNGADIKNNGDGTYSVKGKSKMLVYATKIAKQRGEGYDFPTYDYNQLQKRGFWDSSKDYKNVEVTIYVTCRTLTGTADEFSIITRSVRHEEGDHDGCGGSSYHGSLRFTDGAARLNKEPRHVDYTGYRTSDRKLGKVIGKKIGLKFICYNRSSSSVQNEIWLDKNADNNWSQYIEYLDVGDWIGKSVEGMSRCGALKKGAAITWGSTKISFKDNGLDLKFEKLSVRSILGKKMDVLPTTGTGGGTGEVSRIFSKYVIRYDIIVDTSGATCGTAPEVAGYSEVTSLTVDDVNEDKEISGDIPDEDDRKGVGWFCSSDSSKLKGIKPRRVQVYLRKQGSPTGNCEVKILDSSHNTKVSYGTLDVSTLTGSYSLKTFTNDNAPGSIPDGIQRNWKLAVVYTSGSPSNYVEVGINDDDVVDSDRTQEWQWEKQGGSEYVSVKHDDREMCGKIFT